MNQKLVWLSVAVGVLIVGVGAYVIMNKSNTFTPKGNINTMVDTPKSFLDLMAMSTSQKCTVAIADGTSGVQNTIYMANGKMRMESEITTVVKNIPETINSKQNVHVITDGADAYTWIDGLPTGFKMSLDKFKEATPASAQEQAGDITQKFDYKCEAWSADNSVFAIPTAIKFTSTGI